MDDRVLWVVCLCAEWCGVCRDYRAVWQGAAERFGAHARFRWLDVEDDAALLGDLDVENFPTLLIASGDASGIRSTQFFGPLTPQPGTLARLVEGALAGALPAPASTPELDALARHLHETC